MRHELKATQAIYYRIGGAPTVSAAVDLSFERIVVDPELRCLWKRTSPERLKCRQRLLLIQVLGGPEVYDGPDLRRVHGELEVTDRQLDRLRLHLTAALQQLGVGPAIILQIAWILDYLRPEVLGIT